MVKAYKETGTLPPAEVTPLSSEALQNFVAQGEPGDYVALQAYVQPSEETWEALQALRLWIRDQTHLATTLGYGPRYLHSTGQLHKGDAGNGLFVQLTSSSDVHVSIPDAPGASEASLTFGVLVKAQAQGDYEALREVGRRVIRFEVQGDVAQQITSLVA
jgi:phytoene dehydrogenase-like protein